MGLSTKDNPKGVLGNRKENRRDRRDRLMQKSGADIPENPDNEDSIAQPSYNDTGPIVDSDDPIEAAGGTPAEHRPDDAPDNDDDDGDGSKSDDSDNSHSSSKASKPSKSSSSSSSTKRRRKSS